MVRCEGMFGLETEIRSAVDISQPLSGKSAKDYFFGVPDLSDPLTCLSRPALADPRSVAARTADAEPHRVFHQSNLRLPAPDLCRDSKP